MRRSINSLLSGSTSLFVSIWVCWSGLFRGFDSFWLYRCLAGNLVGECYHLGDGTGGRSCFDFGLPFANDTPPQRHGAAGALAMANEANIADIEIIYSSSRKRANLTGMSSSEILKTGPHSGGEGLKKCVEENMDKLLSADVGIIFTDAHLTDGDCDFSPLRGKTLLIGACIVESSEWGQYAKLMRKHFQSFELASSAEELTRRLVQKIIRAS